MSTGEWRQPNTAPRRSTITAMDKQPLNISPYPTLTWTAFTQRTKNQIASLLDEKKNSIRLTNARTAIYHALNIEGIGTDSKVLTPSLLCGSMTSPTLATGATPDFYKINEDLSINTEDLISRITKKTKAIIVTHYFGFPQNKIHRIRSVCDESGIILIEDCAHALYGDFAGTHGHYAVGSIQKFLPVLDGGMLISDNEPLPIDLDIRNPRYEAKIAHNTIEKFLGDRGQTARREPDVDKESAADTITLVMNAGTDLDMDSINRKMSIASSLICKFVSHGTIQKKRRANYTQLADALDQVPGCRLPYRDLPEDIVPYVLPVIVERADPTYQDIRRQGVYIQRWEPGYHGNITGHCDTSDYYANHLFQIPCHQELSSEDITNISRVIEDALSK